MNQLLAMNVIWEKGVKCQCIMEVELHYQTISSPLASNFKRRAWLMQKAKRRKTMYIVLGEGAASEGDFHAGLNMASVLSAPVIFSAVTINTRSQHLWKSSLQVMVLLRVV